MGRGRQIIRAEILMTTGRPHNYGHFCKFKRVPKKKDLWWLFGAKWKFCHSITVRHHAFHDLINVYSCRIGADNPREQNFDVNRNLLSLRSFATSFKKSLWSLILYNFFHDFIHVFSPRAGADNPLGIKFWGKQEHIITWVICCKFKKKSLEIWFYTIVFLILYMYIAGQGQTAPRGQSFDSTEMFCHFIHLLQV